jgi:plasmid stabilization system protein ParE
MALVVFFTGTAIGHLEAIFDYYKNRADAGVAQNIVGRLTSATIILKTNPTIGQIEELLKKRKYQYRYLVSGNYKIIYRITDTYVMIAAVFDCRQNPKKMKMIK